LIIHADHESFLADAQNRRVITDADLDASGARRRKLARQLRNQGKLAARWAAPGSRRHLQPMVARFTGIVTTNTVPRG
jgi:hypothetical protein